MNNVIRVTAEVYCKKDLSRQQHSFRCESVAEFKELVKHLYYCESRDLMFRNIKLEQA